jgi:hypothetical protein
MARPMSIAPRTFDDAKLTSMIEPLTVRVEKIKGSTRTPIPLQEGENGEPAGTEWTKDNVRGIEQFLVASWSGGGLYEITVTDSSTPTPLTMKWSPFWNIAEYPELIPPPLAAARAAGTPIAPPAPVAPQPQATPRAMSAFPNGLPMFQQPQAYAAPQPYPQPTYPGYAYAMPPPPQVGTPAWPQWNAEAERRRESEEVRQLREENQRREREMVAAKHAAELERERQANETRYSRYEAQLTDLRNMIATLATTVQNGATSKAPNAELELLKENNRRLAEQAENEKREREAERRERETRDALKAVQEANQRQFELMQRTIEAMQSRLTEAANAGNKHDPMLAMIQEQARQHADAIKEIARNQAASLERIQAFMMNPRDMFLMAKESQSSVEQTTERISKLFGSVIDVQQKVTENLLQMQPGGSGALDVVRDGLTGIKELAERYVGVKATNERIAMQAQASIAQANATAYAAAHGAQAAQQVTAPAPNGLSGNVAAAPPEKKKPKKPASVAQTAGVDGDTRVAQTSSAKPEKKIVITGPGAKRLGKTDAEWFGPLISNVEELREGVDRYIESLSMDPPRVDAKGNPDGISPEQSAIAVATAVQTVMEHKLMIPVMVDLMFQDRFADFFDVVLPNAPQTYRDDATQAFIEIARKLGAVAGDGEVTDQSSEADDEDNADDDDDGDDANEVAA